MWSHALSPPDEGESKFSEAKLLPWGLSSLQPNYLEITGEGIVLWSEMLSVVLSLHPLQRKFSPLALQKFCHLLQRLATCSRDEEAWSEVFKVPFSSVHASSQTPVALLLLTIHPPSPHPRRNQGIPFTESNKCRTYILPKGFQEVRRKALSVKPQSHRGHLLGPVTDCATSTTSGSATLASSLTLCSFDPIL